MSVMSRTCANPKAGLMTRRCWRCCLPVVEIEIVEIYDLHAYLQLRALLEHQRLDQRNLSSNCHQITISQEPSKAITHLRWLVVDGRCGCDVLNRLGIGAQQRPSLLGIRIDCVSYKSLLRPIIRYIPQKT